MNWSRKGIVVLVIGWLLAGPVLALSADDLDKQLRDRQKQIEELERKAKTYQQNIDIKRSQALTLNNQLNILTDEIEKIKINIEETKLKIAQLNDQISQVEKNIGQLDQTIKDRQQQLQELVRTLDKLEQKSLLEIFLSSPNWYDALADRRQLSDVAGQVQRVTEQLRDSQQAYNRSQQTLSSRKTDAVLLKKELDDQSSRLAYQSEAKRYILRQTKSQEKQFQLLLTQVKKEEAAAEADIRNLEAKIRQRLQQSGVSFDAIGRGGLSWPVASRRITTSFYDPTYPFRRIFEHPGIDIGSTPQGTPIRAAAAGYVGRAKNAGMGYSYIMLVHGNGLSTVYAHVSKILVQEDSYVARGQVIGLSGGTPGTPGAGPFTTGPHLHFEVRLNGLPVNPFNYLP